MTLGRKTGEISIEFWGILNLYLNIEFEFEYWIQTSIENWGITPLNI